MKTILMHLSTLVTLLLSTNKICGQNIVEIDFETKTILGKNILDGLKHGEYFQVKITNINTALYKVSINHSDSTTTTTLIMPDYGGINLDALTKLIGGIGPFQTISSIAPEIISSPNSNIQKAIDFNKYLKSHTEALEIWGNFEATPLTVTKDPIKDRMKTEKQTLEQFKQDVLNLKIRVDELYLNVSKATLTSKKEFGPFDVTYDFEKAWLAIQNLRTEIKDLITETNTASDSYKKFASDATNEPVIAADDKLKESDSSIKGAYGELVKSCDGLIENINASKASELLSTVLLHNNNSTLIYTSLPIQFSGDKGNLKINITPRSDDLKLQSYYTELHFPKKESTYAGTGLTFFYTQLNDDAYSAINTQLNDSTSAYSLVREDEQKGEFGSALLFRFGTKLAEKDNMGVHFSVGPAVSIANKLKPRIALGGGLSFGNKNCLTFDIGAMLGYSERKSNAYTLNKTYSEKPSQTTVPMLCSSYFVGIGYMLRL